MRKQRFYGLGTLRNLCQFLKKDVKVKGNFCLVYPTVFLVTFTGVQNFMKKINFLICAAFVSIVTSFAVSAQTVSSSESVRSLPEAVGFESANAFSDGGGVWVSWQMKIEHENLGFNVYKISNKLREIANPHFISGGYLRDNQEATIGGRYSFFDPYGGVDSVYQIETLAVNGQKNISQEIVVRRVERLSTVAGRTSGELTEAARNASYLIEKNEPSLPKALNSELSANSLPADPTNQKFIASQPGVKLGTKKEGIYRVTRIELQNAGFDVNMPFQNWQLFMNGNEQSIIVGDNGSYVEFYGNGINTNESGTQAYFLMNGSQPGKRIINGVARRIGASVISKSFNQSYYRADRVIYVNSIRNGEGVNFFNHIVNTAGGTVNFNLDSIDRNTPQAVLSVAVQGITMTPHLIDVTLNGTTLQQITGSNFDLMTKSYVIPTALLVDGTNNLQLKVPSGAGDVSLVESMRVTFDREYVASQNALSFFTKSYKQSELKGFTSPDVRVFDTTYPDAPQLIGNLIQTTAGGLTSLTIPSSRNRRMFAAGSSAILSVDSIEQNLPSTLSTANHSAALIVICPQNWVSEAQAWANYRIAQGTSAEVVRISDIYDEFNYGIVSSNSVRSFLQFAKNNWQGAPNYVLLLGDASYDPRGYRGFPDVNFVPTKMFDTAYEETGSDEALVDFNDDGLAELAIGRITARSAAEISMFLNRVVTFELSAAQGFSRGALFVSDVPNGYDFAGMSQRLANELPVGTPTVMVNRGDTDARTTLLAQLNTGKYLVNYSGHGAPSLWAASTFYSSPDVATLSNGTNYSIFSLLTCLNGYFIAPDYDSLAELLIKAPNGGGVAAWASSGKTTPDVQEVLARRFYQKISEGSILRLGDLIKDAKLNVLGGRDVRLSWTLLGDPMLMVH